MTAAAYLMMLAGIVLTPLACQAKLLEIAAGHGDLPADTWRTYWIYFRMAKTLNVKLLLDPDHSAHIERIANVHLKRIQTGFSVTLRRFYQRDIAQPPYLDSDYVARIPVRTKATDALHTNKCMKQLGEIRRISSDLYEGTVMIAWNQSTMLRILNDNARQIVRNPRVLHAVIFISTACDPEAKKYVFPIFWKWYDVLNVLLQAPWSQQNHIYKYHPFGSNGTGEITKLSVRTALQNNCYMLSSLKDMQGYRLPVSIFERKPTAIKIKRYLTFNPVYDDLGDINLVGMDGSVLGVLAQRLNFRPIVDKGAAYFGRKLENGTFTQALGKVARREVELSANGRFLEFIDPDKIEFTRSVSYEKMCVVVPKALRIPQWLIMLLSFPVLFWVLVPTFGVVCATIRYLSARLDPAAARYADKAWLEMLSIFIAASTPLSPQKYGRILLSFCLPSNMILMGIFQANLFKSFSTVNYFNEINTLEDLVRSGLQISTPTNVFNDKHSVIMEALSGRRLRKRLYNVTTMEYIAYVGGIGGVERKRDAELFSTQYVDADGQPLLHIIPECLSTNIIAYIVPKGSPFLPRIDWMLMRFVEAGFIEKWYYDVVDGLTAEQKIHSEKQQEVQRPFKLHDLQVAFFILGIGLVAASLAFIAERTQTARNVLCRGKRRKSNKWL